MAVQQTGSAGDPGACDNRRSYDAPSESGDMDSAYKDFTRLAPQGNATAEFYLAFMMDKGLGVPANPFAAVWPVGIKRRRIRSYLAGDHLDGVYIQRRAWRTPRTTKCLSFQVVHQRRRRWAAPMPRTPLARCCATGAAIKKIISLANQWFLQAATQGNARAQSNLAAMYYLGHGVKANISVAVYPGIIWPRSRRNHLCAERTGGDVPYRRWRRQGSGYGAGILRAMLRRKQGICARG